MDRLRPAFLLLGCFGLVSIALWLVFSPAVKNY